MFFSLVLCACATKPPAPVSDAPVTATDTPRSGRSVARTERVRVAAEVAPYLRGRDGSDNEGRMASNVSVGIDRLLQYRASWSVEPGDVLFAEASPDAAATARTRLGSHQLGQDVTLQLPELAGAPMSLAVATELENDWLPGGFTELKRERAKLSWSPVAARVDVQWSGSATLFDDRVALVCDLQSSIHVPVRERSGGSAAIRLSGRNCRVADDGTRYGGADAQAYGLSYAWGNPKLGNEAAFSVIDPRWTTDFDWRRTRPAYELGFSHRRDFGALSAKGLVALRQGQRIDGAPTPELAVDPVGRRHDDWTANASLNWQLPEASLSANWARGIDRFWFTPDRGQASDRFGFALNLSHWVESLLPAASPQLAMNWNWSEIRLLNAEAAEAHSLKIDLALLF